MNHLNNMDIRAGLVAEIRVNCNAVEQMYIDGSEKEGELEWLCDDMIKESFWKEFNLYISPEDLMNEEELMYKFQEHLEDWKKYVIYKEYEEDTEEVDRFTQRQFIPHHQSVLVINDEESDEEDTEEEESEDEDGYCGCFCDNCKSYRVKGKWVGCEKCDTECCICCEIKYMEKEEDEIEESDSDEEGDDEPPKIKFNVLKNDSLIN